MIKNFVALPDPKIRQTSAKVTSFDKSVESVIKDLLDTAQIQKDPPALGLAAPQIGVFKKIFVAKIRGKFKPFVNARVLKYSQKEGAFLEGCFSVTNRYGQVIRPLEVEVEAQDAQGKLIRRKYKGLSARILQHEIDHLSGILFVDHVKAQNSKLLFRFFWQLVLRRILLIFVLCQILRPEL